MAPMPPPDRRIINTNSATSSNTGPNVNRIVVGTDVPDAGDVALMTTRLPWSRRKSASLFANSGI